MVYFSKISRNVINISNITHIEKEYVTQNDCQFRVYFIGGGNIIVESKDYEQLMADIYHAATLMRIQKESKE